MGHNDNYTVIVPEKPDIALLPPSLPSNYVVNDEKPLGCMPPGLEASDGFKTGIVNCGFPKEFGAIPVQFKIGIEQLNDSLADEYGDDAVDPAEVWHDLCRDAGDEVCSLVVKDFIARLD